MVGTGKTRNPEPWPSYKVYLHSFTAMAWFCYDFVTYPFGIFSSTIIEQLNPNNTTVQNIGYGVRIHAMNTSIMKRS